MYSAWIFPSRSVFRSISIALSTDTIAPQPRQYITVAGFRRPYPEGQRNAPGVSLDGWASIQICKYGTDSTIGICLRPVFSELDSAGSEMMAYPSFIRTSRTFSERNSPIRRPDSYRLATIAL